MYALKKVQFSCFTHHRKMLSITRNSLWIMTSIRSCLLQLWFIFIITRLRKNFFLLSWNFKPYENKQREMEEEEGKIVKWNHESAEWLNSNQHYFAYSSAICQRIKLISYFRKILLEYARCLNFERWGFECVVVVE